MNTRIGMIALLALGTLWVSAQTAMPTPDESASFSLKVTTIEPSNLGGHVSVEISLTNISDRTIHVRRTNGNVGAADFDVFAQDESGNGVPESSFYRALKGSPPKDSSQPKFSIRQDFQIIDVDPGQSIQSSIDLGKVFDLGHIGNYKVWVERTDNASKKRIKSNMITVVIRQ